MLKENLESVEEKIQEACKKSGRNREDVTLVAASKTKPVETLQEAYDLGVRVFGENKVQELTEKYDSLPKDIHWHMIGHLQTNKVKDAVRLTSLIHSVDSLHLLAAIDKEAAKQNKCMPVLLQINFANEETKSGFTVEEAPLALELAQRFANIKVKGIMTIGAHSEDEALIRKSFQQAHDFYITYQKKYQLDTLSMGMSNDYPLALEYGTTLIRVGSKIFGERQYNQ